MRAFGDYNPAVIFVCMMSCACTVMFSFNPLIALISLVGAAALWFVRNGRSSARSHLFYLALLVIIPAVNLLFSHNGATVLLVVNDSPLTLESLLYGLWAAVTVISVLYWFRSFSQIMTSDRLLYLLGGLSPKLALILTCALRFVPHFRQQLTKTEHAQRALGLYKEDNFFDLVKGKLRVYSIMITWALENGITTADSMAARGYGTGRRSTFSLYRFRRSDGVVLAIALALLTVCLVGIGTGAVDYSFYPEADPIPASPMCAAVYLCYGGLVMLPTIIEAEVKIRWRSLRSVI